MNTLKQISETYLRANRTIEQIRIFDGHVHKDFFIYNYEGIYFRIFETQKEAESSANGSFLKPLVEFENNLLMEKFLCNFNLTSLSR